MKILVRSLTALAVLGLAPLGCEVHQPDLPAVEEFCAQAGWAYDDDGNLIGNFYEFRPIGTHPDQFGINHPDGTVPIAGGMAEPRDLAPSGSFEPGEDEFGRPVSFWVKSGALLVDDDDLTDDLPAYEEAVVRAQELLADNPSAVETYKNMAPDALMDAPTDAEQAAADFVNDVVAELLPLCPRLTEDAAGIAPRPGDDLLDGTFPSFTACKDKFNASGDGIVGTFELLREGHAEQDALLAECQTSQGAPNRNALNLWGPLTTRASDVEGLPPEPVDGFTFSGLVVPLETSGYRWTMDRSQWEGVSFWARLATAEEALPPVSEDADGNVGPTLTPGGLPPLSGAEIPEGARPQDGVGQVGIIVQTIDTGAVLTERGTVDFMAEIGVCEEDQDPETDFCFATQAEFDAFPGLQNENDPSIKYAYHSEVGENPSQDVPWTGVTPVTPEVPLCIDYSPADIIVGEEPSYRDHCWDGFRTMIDVTPEWKYYFLPFDEMRQAGWGRVGQSFRIDQLRSINLLTSAFQPINIMVDEIAFYRSRQSEEARAAAAMGGATN